MAKQADPVEEKVGIITRVKEFYEEVMAEMKKVTWPSKEELKTSTSVVMLLLAVAAVTIYFYDVIFQIVVVGLFKLV
jgi:preprotein translocase subunit SecE